MKYDRIYLDHILLCIEKVERFLKKSGKKGFKKDDLVQGAVLYYLQTMSESTQKLSKQLKMNVKDIPWHDISDFRNKLVHDYLGIDLEIVYDVVKNELPKLKKRVKEMLKYLDKKENF